MISTVNLSVQFGEKPLFENVSIKFSTGNRYGLIGANGCGKSTFMKILSGEQEASSGEIVIDTNTRLGKLGQDQFAYEEVNVLDVVMMGHEEMWSAMTERDAIYANTDATDEDYIKAAELESKYAEFGGYSSEARAGELLIGAGIDSALHKGAMKNVPPGWKVRVLLAQALFSDPDILLLDEPTNNLDIDTIRWLEGVLDDKTCTMIIISHDRHFLNSVCTHMADLDYGEIKVYPGNYDDYMLASSEARARLMAETTRSKEKISELQEFIRRFAANKSKAKQATSRRKLIDKLQSDAVSVRPSSRQNPYIRFTQKKKLYRQALHLQSLSKGFEIEKGNVIESFSAIVESGEKIAIIGPNGSGKSTLLNLIVGSDNGGFNPDSGVCKLAENAELGYMKQDVYPAFETNKSLNDWLLQHAGDEDDDQTIRSTLGKLLFSGSSVSKPASVISGGEKHRMYFGKLMLLKANILLLDEPTNHLDMESIESLQLALEKFDGTVLVVSHDREFVNSIAKRIWVIDSKQNKIQDFSGTYDEYLLTKEN
ncbi:ABC-F family ATPase [Betaproteobacteria bacterium]|nr:ABC-F family ATPase [Betaproteobacteria bacterium]